MKLEICAPLNIQFPRQHGQYRDMFAEAIRAFWNTDIGRACVGSHVEFNGITSKWTKGGYAILVDGINVTISSEMRFKEPIEEHELVRLRLKYNGRLIDE